MNVRLTLEYDGTEFHGWQYQPGQRTVQGILEDGLLRLLGETIRPVGAGRTDAGVHALAQVAHFHTATRLTPGAIGRGLNGLLPRDIAIRSAEEAPEGFHARRDARRRRYRYTIVRSRRAIGRAYAWHLPWRLDVAAMREAAAGFVGRRSFASFCNTAAEREGHDCHVMECAWSDEADVLRLDVAADRFLRGMVRTMVGTMVDVGRGRLPARAVPAMLDARDRRAACGTAPARGLCLVGVEYDPV